MDVKIKVDYEELSVAELGSSDLAMYKCMDCGHSGNTYKQSERVINSNAPDSGVKTLPENKSASEEDDIAVLCPKCLSWFYFEEGGK